MITVFGSRVGQTEIDQVTDSLNNQWLGMGPKTKALEEGFAKHGKLDHFVLVNSGSNALFMACTLLNLPKGSEVIIPSFTWVSCAQAILLAGLKPVFCDVDLTTMNITADLIKPHITNNTSAIMIVHYAGLPVEMQPILDLGFPVIEDAAHCSDGWHKGKICGSMGAIGCYSFDAVKNLAMGEGGGITMHSADHFDRAKKLRYSGIGKSGFEASTHGKKRWWEYDIVEPSIKMNPCDVTAAIGLGQLQTLPQNQARRKQVWDAYQSELKSVDWIITPTEAEQGDIHGYFCYSIRVTNGKRDDLAHYLFEKDIYTTLRYHPLHMNKLYGQMDKNLPNCQQLNEDCLSIPLHPRISDENVSYIVETLKAFA